MSTIMLTARVTKMVTMMLTKILTKMVTMTTTLGDLPVAQWAQSTSQKMRPPGIQVRHDGVSGDNDVVVIIVISIIMRINPGHQH